MHNPSLRLTAWILLFSFFILPAFGFSKAENIEPAKNFALDIDALIKGEEDASRMVEILEMIRDSIPGDGDIRLFLAMARYRKGDIKDSLKIIDDIRNDLDLENQSKGTAGQSLSGKLYTLSAEHIGRLFYFQALCQKDRGVSPVLVKGSLEAARSWGFSPGYMNILMIYLLTQEEKWSEAEELIKEISSGADYKEETAFIRGYVNAVWKYDDKAVSYFQEAVYLNPESVEARRNLVRIYTRMGKEKEAEEIRDSLPESERKISWEVEYLPSEYWNRLIYEKPVDYDAYFKKKEVKVLKRPFNFRQSSAIFLNEAALKILRTEANVRKALSIMELAAWSAKALAPLRANIGILYYDLSESIKDPELEAIYMKKALENADIALKISQDNLSAIDLKTNIFFKLKQFDKALVTIERVAELIGNTAQVHFNRGVIYWHMKDLDMAVSELKTALAKENTSLASLNSHSSDEIALAPTLVVSEAPISYKAHRFLGVVFEEKGRYKDAEEEFLIAIRLGPSRSEAYLDFGMFLHRRRRNDEARKYLMKYIELGGRRQEEVKGIINRIR